MALVIVERLQRVVLQGTRKKNLAQRARAKKKKHGNLG